MYKLTYSLTHSLTHPLFATLTSRTQIAQWRLISKKSTNKHALSSFDNLVSRESSKLQYDYDVITATHASIDNCIQYMAALTRHYSTGQRRTGFAGYESSNVGLWGSILTDAFEYVRTRGTVSKIENCVRTPPTCVGLRTVSTACVDDVRTSSNDRFLRPSPAVDRVRTRANASVSTEKALLATV